MFDDEVEKYRDESSYRKPIAYTRQFYEAGVFGTEEDRYLKEIVLQKRQLEKLKKQIQTEKLEYNKWLREEARDDLITEKIVTVISQQPKLDIPNPIETKNNERCGVLAFGDEHFGIQFELRGLMNEIINAYSPEIFYERMTELLNQTISIVKKENLTHLHIFSMGDFTEGILRCSQLMKLKYGVVEGTVLYSNYICEWLNELSKYVFISFQTAFENHSELRMLGQPKGTFENENMGLVVKNSIKVRLKNNSNFEYVENPTGFIYANIFGFNFLGLHGEIKSMKDAIKEFSSIYKINIDYLIAGHLHHSRSEDVGINSSVINIPSIIGVDPYALSLRKTSNAGATLFIIEKDKGKSVEYSIKLK